jgi:putative spermidine/putrescine transport system ATP-binding protein
MLSNTLPNAAPGEPQQDRGESAPAIVLSGVAKQFGSVHAVRSIDLEVYRGELVSFLGPSGSGKTTSLMMVAGHELPDGGSILIAGRDITATPPHRRDIGMVFQHYALFPHLTVEQNVAFPLRMRNLPRDEIAKKVAAILDLVKLEGLAARFPKQLSGGQSQRVALARALVFDPSILLMDEPLSALDKKLREEMQFEIKRIQKSLAITTLYVTHDQNEALVLSDRIVVFERGRIAQIGKPQEIYDRPQTRFVADFLGEMSFVTGQLAEVSGNYCKVTLAPGLTVTGRLSGAGDAPGKVWVGVRPEAILVDADASHAGVNQLSGVVEAVDHYGEGCRIKLRLSLGQSLTVKQANTGIFKHPGVGERVRLSWSWDKTTVIGEQEGSNDRT